MHSQDPSKLPSAVGATGGRRGAVREKALLIEAHQRKVHRVRRALIGAAIVSVLALVGAGVTAAIVSSSNNTQLSPGNAHGEGFVVTSVSSVGPVRGDAYQAAAAPTPSPTSAVTADIRIYVDYLAPGAKEFQLANSDQLSTWVSSGAVTLSYFPVAMLTAKTNGTKFSLRAASAAACVATIQPDAFFAFNQALLTQQPAPESDGLSDKAIADIAISAGVTQQAQVRDCIEHEKYTAWVKDATESAVKSLPGTDGLKLSGTPTILVNGKQYTGSLSDPSQFSQFVLTSSSSKYYSATTTPSP